MTHKCTVCQIEATIEELVRLYDDSYEEVYRNSYIKGKIDHSYVHLICSSFFLQTELIILNNISKSHLLNDSENSKSTEVIICNFKGLKDQSKHKCLICSELTETEVLIPCLAK